MNFHLRLRGNSKQSVLKRKLQALYLWIITKVIFLSVRHGLIYVRHSLINSSYTAFFEADVDSTDPGAKRMYDPGSIFTTTDKKKSRSDPGIEEFLKISTTVSEGGKIMTSDLMIAYKTYVSYVNRTRPENALTMPTSQKKFTSMMNEIIRDFDMVYKRNIGCNKPGYVGRELRSHDKAN